MEAVFENATIKVWFNSQSTSRNFKNVVTIIHSDNSVLITTKEGMHHILNMNNINMIEQLD